MDPVQFDWLEKRRDKSLKSLMSVLILHPQNLQDQLVKICPAEDSEGN